MKKTNLQDIIVVQMYEIVKIQMHFQWNYLIYIYFNRFEDLGKIIKNKDYLFSLGQSMKKLIMVKVGHFVWDKLWCRIML
jgi:hypothetical protein